MDAMLPLIIYFVQITLPFLGLLIVCCSFRSLFSNLSSKHPLIALVNKSTGEKIPIVYWENSIGRDRHCDVVVNNPTVSRDHAVLYRRDEGWIISETFYTRPNLNQNGDDYISAARKDVETLEAAFADYQ